MRKRLAPGLPKVAVTLALIVLSAAVARAHEGFFEGFGAITRGAADCPGGFSIYRVTSLGDDGPGSLREAISQGCRYVVFDVAGAITLASSLTLGDSYLTIDGASAPAPGITIYHPTINEKVAIAPRLLVGPSHDIIVHNLTHIGPGGHDETSSDIWGLDGTVHPVYNVILHHITAFGSNDGIFDMAGEVHDVTVSWNLIFGTMTATSITGGTERRWNISVHHNVFAQNRERQVKVRGNTEVDYVNNVVYGWGWQGCAGRGVQIESVEDIDPWINVEHNVFHHVTSGVSCVEDDGAIVFQNGVGGSQAYFNGNTFPPSETSATSTAPRLPIPFYAEVTRYAASTLGDMMVGCAGTRHGTASERALLQEISIAIGGNGGPCPPFTSAADPAVLPDLVESALNDPPGVVVLGSSFSITETVQNIGTGPSGASAIGFHLASAPSKGSTDVRFVAARTVSGLTPGESSAGTVTLVVPSSTPLGTYYLLACADDMWAVMENNEANNCVASTTTLEVKAPDLVEFALSNPPTMAVLGGSFSVTDIVENVGTGPSGGSTTRYYLSEDMLESSSDVAFSATRAVPDLASGATSTGTVTVTVPSSTPLATYYLLACADAWSAVMEDYETNNCVASATTVQITVPDLVEPALTDPPSTLMLGGSFPVTDTTGNVGTGPSGGSTTRYYLSTDTLKSDTDVRFSATRAVPDLDAGATSTGTVTVNVPSTTPLGSYYLLACADDKGAVLERNEANNCAVSATTATTVQVAAPDLVEPTLSDPPSTMVLLGSFPVTDTVGNIGTGLSGSSTTRYYLSPDVLKSSTDVRFTATRAVPQLAASATSTGTVNVKVPSATPLGSYYLLACADDKGAVKEANEANNCAASATAVQVTAPDLVEPTLSDPPSTMALLGSFPVTDTVGNIGTGLSGSSTTRYYLSPDVLKSSTDVRFTATRAVPQLAASATSTGTVTVNVPSATPLGSYYLLACADDKGAVKEANEANNCAASATKLQITP
jgi:subtilase family serine protease